MIDNIKDHQSFVVKVNAIVLYSLVVTIIREADDIFFSHQPTSSLCIPSSGEPSMASQCVTSPTKRSLFLDIEIGQSSLHYVIIYVALSLASLVCFNIGHTSSMSAGVFLKVGQN